MSDEWKEEVLKLAYRFAQEGQALTDLASALHLAVEEMDRETCLALVVAFLEQLCAERAGGGDGP